jgi:hypothetical protein
VEIPHSLALALDLAGPAELRAARCWDLRCEDRGLPGLGGAHVELEHRSGVLTLLRSDLGAPVRRRSVVCEFDGGTATAHFPLSEDDDHAQLVVDPFDSGTAAPPPGVLDGDGVPGNGHHVFRDDALTDFLDVAYRGFSSDAGGVGNFPLACATARLLCAAREHCAVTPGAGAGSR